MLRAITADDPPSSGRWRGLWRPVGLVVLFNGALVAWLLVKPGSQALAAGVGDLAQGVGPLAMLALCFPGVWRRWLPANRPKGAIHLPRTYQHLAPVLLATGVFAAAAGALIWTGYEQVLHRPPFPSWADAAYLATYPFLLLGVLLLPARPLPLAARTRVVLDGLMIIAAVATFSWYFILGPTLLQDGESILARVVGTAYPFFDLLLIACLILMMARSRDRTLRPVAYLLTLGLSLYVLTDCLFDLQSLHGGYATGEVLDAGRPLAGMLVVLAAYILQRNVSPSAPPAGRAGAALFEPAVAGSLVSWRALVPYVFVPAVGALLCYVGIKGGHANLVPGVYIGATVLVTLVSLRQVVAIKEAITHNHELRETQSELRARNDALAAANARLRSLSTTDPLTDLPNHGALVSAIDVELERARRYGRPFALVFMDIDHFKALNDAYGHSCGDSALREFGAVVRGTLRAVDSVGRWGGEEFVAILAEATPEEAQAVAERIRAAVAAHEFKGGAGAHLTCSLGTSAYPNDADDRDGLIEAADRAMYAAKRLGRNQVRTAQESAVAAADADTGGLGSRDEATLVGTVEALGALVEARDHYTASHTNQVAAITVRLAMALGLDTGYAGMIGLAARLHDVGKIAVPDAILRKQGRLTAEEQTLMRTHCAVGSDIINRVPTLRGLAPLIRGHHEHWDGSGYPDGLAAGAIPLGARIIAVADAYGAMVTDRPYVAPRSPAQALAELRRCSGTHFDPSVVEAFEQLLDGDVVAESQCSGAA